MTRFRHWITNGSSHAFYTRRSFEIEKDILQAEIHVCGLGQFVLHINGSKIGDHELDPGWTDYRKYIEYVTFDVTDYLKKGENILGAEIGNGWYIMDNDHYSFHFPPFMPENPNPYQPFNKYLVFTMELIITFKDETEQIFYTDEQFKTHAHPTLHSNVYGSETYDARLVCKGWLDSGYNDDKWQPAVIADMSQSNKAMLIEQFQPPIQVIHTYEAKYLHSVNNRDIYDLGQNISGLVEFDIKGNPGDKIYLYPAEKLAEDGDVDQYAKGWMDINTVITYIIGSDQTEHYRQRFSYIAGKVIAIEKSSSQISISNLKVHAVTSAVKKAGTFICDDQRYNQIYDMIEKTVEANMLSVHTDCPTIERFAWQEPNHLMAPSIMFMKDSKLLWEKFLLDMRVSQHTKDDYFNDYNNEKIPAGDGLVPSQCPCYIPNFLPVDGMGSFYDIIPWGSSLILGAMWHYQFYGDKKIISDNFDAGLKYLSYLKTKINPDGFINHGLGDWGNPDQELARENIETAFLYRDADILAQFAHILHNDKEQELKIFAQEVKDNYNSKLLKKGMDGTYTYLCWDKQDSLVTTQACLAIPLYFGMVPEEYEKDVVKNFEKTLRQKDCFASGEVGLPYIIQTAHKYGMDDLIAHFITKPTHPSYYAFILDGMTTLGEYWEQNPRSHCHDMMGHIIEWYYNGIAGIEIKAPGFAKVAIHPYMPEGMNHFICTYRTIHGVIRVEGNRKEGIPTFTYEIPSSIELVD